jgi:hypothetical protein
MANVILYLIFHAKFYKINNTNYWVKKFKFKPRYYGITIKFSPRDGDVSHMWPYEFFCVKGCHNPSLGLTTKARACKVAGQEKKFGRKGSVREWTLTLPREFPPWELESWWTPECLENNCKSQNPMDWEVDYAIENLLKRRCLKWAPMTHLDI